MRRIPPKPVICAIFSIIFAMGLSVCVQDPVNLKGYVEEVKGGGGDNTDNGDNAVQITFSLTDLGTGLTATDAGTSVSINDLTKATPTTILLTFNTTTVPTGYTMTSYRWLYNGSQVGDTGDTSTPVNFEFSEARNIAYVNVGTHTITLEVVINGITFTKDFVITVT